MVDEDLLGVIDLERFGEKSCWKLLERVTEICEARLLGEKGV